MRPRSIFRQSWHYVRSGPNTRTHSPSHTITSVRPSFSGIKLDNTRPNTPSTNLLSRQPQLYYANPIRSPLPSTVRMIHEIAKTGFASGTNDHYDKSRPSYPQEALTALYTSIPKTDGPLKIAELGSGTGLFTRAFLAHPTFGQSVGELRAIEPSEGMRETFNKQTKDSRVTCLPGDFLSTGVEEGWADLVVIAQAFHWCPDYDKAMAEFARILKPKGVAAFIWNLEDRDRSPWVGKIRDIIEPYEQGSPQFRLGLWKTAFDTPSYKANFRVPETKTWDYTVPTTVQGVHDRAFSKSYVAVLESPESDKVHKGIDEALASSEKEWVDEKEGLFKYHYETLLVVMRKL